MAVRDAKGDIKSLEEGFDWQLDHDVDPPRWVGGIAGLRAGAYRAITSGAVGSDEALHTIDLGKLVPEIFDYIALTYVAAGDGVGEIETATYKLGGVGGATVATLTLAYNVDDKISTITKT